MPETNPAQLERELAEVVAGSVRFDRQSRAMYSADASNYRQLPICVVQPKDADDVAATVGVCHRLGVPIVPRGAGTSIAGNAINVAVVLDFSRHMNKIVSIDPEKRTARVQPGVVLDDLRAAAAPYGLTFGPDPSTANRCTLGGMIGNNACGSHSVAWGKTVDNVHGLEVLLADGTRMSLGTTDSAGLDRLAESEGRPGEVYRGLRDLAARRGDLVRETFPELTRRVSGYNLDQLLPGGPSGAAGAAGAEDNESDESDEINLARALVGSEGSCVAIVEAEVRLVEAPAARSLAVLGFPDQVVAADNVLPLLELSPLTIESVDAAITGIIRDRHPHNPVLDVLPEGEAWLFVEMGGEDADEAERRARAVTTAAADFPGGQDGQGASGVVVSDPATMKALWKIRGDGAGYTTRLPDGSEAYPGWEDAAVPPAKLGSYLRGLNALLHRHGRQGVYYGHFGDGCMHIRIDFDLLTENGVADFRTFMEEAADLVVEHGGSLSGEHGDGQARGELLDRMYDAEVLRAFAEFKRIWDPDNLMNPNRIVDSARLDEDLRVFIGEPAIPVGPGDTKLAFPHDEDGFLGATRRCMGVGKCLSSSGGVMCPSYRATGEEKDSTRGRARLLFEMANGKEITDGWQSEEVRDALDLCLACKGCKTDCPVNVDMATYKAEFLYQHYKGKRRPMTHYSMGRLPQLMRLAAPFARLANAGARVKPLAAVAKRMGGIAPERDIPTLATRRFTKLFGRRRKNDPRTKQSPPASNGARPRVLLWPDTFTNYFDPQVGLAAVDVLESLGYEVCVPNKPVCCGLTTVSTGQLDAAKKVLNNTLQVLKPWLDEDVPVIGLEPSCTALFRGELTQLLPDSDDAKKLSRLTRTFAELLAEHTDGFDVKHPGQRALVQVHCHQHSELGFSPDRKVLAALGVEAEVLDSGCCGLAGNFGFEKGHYDVSMSAGERVLLPAVREADDQTAMLADGFSCRTQIRQAPDTTGRAPVHLAELAKHALDA